MAPATATRTPLEMLAALARRGEADLHAVAQLARGEQAPSPEMLDGLVRGGFVRGGAHPRVPVTLLIPALALDAALGLRGEEMTAQLVALLEGARSAGARGLILQSLADQLSEHLRDLRDPQVPVDRDALRATVQALTETLDRLSGAADPAQVTRVAGMCAKVIEALARALTPRRQRTQQTLPALGAEQLAAAVRDMALSSVKLVKLPSAATLAAALAGPAAPLQSAGPAVQLRNRNAHGRHDTLSRALASADPLDALYGGQEVNEALRRHCWLTALAPEALRSAGWLPADVRRTGPQPLQWSTELQRVAADAELAA